jgi:hypothetical protein
MNREYARKFLKSKGISENTNGKDYVSMFESGYFETVLQEYQHQYIQTKNALPFKEPLDTEFICRCEKEDMWLICTFTPTPNIPNCFTDNIGGKHYHIVKYRRLE